MAIQGFFFDESFRCYLKLAKAHLLVRWSYIHSSSSVLEHRPALISQLNLSANKFQIENSPWDLFDPSLTTFPDLWTHKSFKFNRISFCSCDMQPQTPNCTPERINREINHFTITFPDWIIGRHRLKATRKFALKLQRFPFLLYPPATTFLQFVTCHLNVTLV